MSINYTVSNKAFLANLSYEDKLGDLEIRHIAYQPEVQGSKNADYDPHHLDLELGHPSKLLFTGTDVELEPALNHRQAA